jgi:hypothetical protein
MDILFEQYAPELNLQDTVQCKPDVSSVIVS